MSLSIFTPTFDTSTFYFVIKGDFESYTPYLQYLPDNNAAYGVGGGFAALLLASLATAFLARAHVFLTGTLASVFLMISFFLRASLTDSADNRKANQQMYIASYVLNSCGAFFLMFMSFIMASKWCRYLDDDRSAIAGLLLGFGGFVLLGCLTLECAGIPMSFGTIAYYRYIGHIFHISAVSAVLGTSIIGLLVTVFKAVTDTGREILVEMVNLAVPFTLLALWASFALAQTKLPLSNVANTSEIMWYLLNPLPLGLILLVWTVFNAPRVFSYDDYYAHKPSPPAYNQGRYGGHYEYPPRDDEMEYSYPLRVRPANEYRSDSHSSQQQQQQQQQRSDTYYQYANGREMTTDDKIQKAILKYA